MNGERAERKNAAAKNEITAETKIAIETERLTETDAIREKLDQYLAFINEAELLKSVVRDAWTSTGRQESTAEHSWRLALLASLFLSEFPKLDRERVLMLCLVHDLGELYEGDISAVLMPDAKAKYETELRAVTRLFSMLPRKAAGRYMALWEEYEKAETEEALFVKALDKAETILQHNRGRNPQDFDYTFNLEYGKAYFEGNEWFRELRKRLDDRTRELQERKEDGIP